MKIIEKFNNKLKYKSEFLFSKNPAVKISFLAVFALIITLLTTLVLKLSSIMPAEWQELPISKLFWLSLMRVIDQGTMVEDQGSWSFLIIILITTVIGLIIISTLISIITQAIESRMEELKKGRSAVIEKKHYIILGWSSKIYNIINELIIGHRLAGRHPRKPCIVVLADKDKVEMEDSIADNCPNSINAKIICRSGNPIILEKLGKLSLANAESVLILATDKKNPDTFVFKILLAILQICSAKKKIRTKTVIAEIEDNKNLVLLREQIKICSSKNAAVDRKLTFIPFNSSKIISEIIAQTSVQQKLSAVYNELLTFNSDDNEIYIETADKLDIDDSQYSFRDLLNCFPKACPIGIITNQIESQEDIIINPLTDSKFDDYKIKTTDKLVFIAKKRNDIDFKKPAESANDLDCQNEKINKLPVSNTIIFGYNKKLIDIIIELEHYIDPESKLLLVMNLSEEKLSLLKQEIEKCESINLKIDYECQSYEIVDAELINKLSDHKLPGIYDNIILLNSYKYSGNTNHLSSLDELTILEETDAQTIKSLLNVRNHFDLHPQLKGPSYSIVTELKFSHNKDLVPKEDADEFIISDEIISSIIAQTIIDKNLGNVYMQTLLSSDGSEIYLKDPEYYKPFSKFSDVIQSAANIDEIAIGYILNSGDNQEIVINPAKDNNISPDSVDRIITIAEDFCIRKR